MALAAAVMLFSSTGCIGTPQEIRLRDRLPFQPSAAVAFYSEDAQITNRFFARRALLRLISFYE